MNQTIPKAPIDWPGHIESHQNSTLSVKAYCDKHNLNYDQFGYYKRKLATRSKTKKPIGSGFVAARHNASGSVSVGSLSLVLSSGVRIEGVTDGNMSTCLSLLGRLL